MSKLKQFVLDLGAREDGPTSVEYAIMLALIIVACIAAIGSIGNNAQATAEIVADAIGGSPEPD